MGAAPARGQDTDMDYRPASYTLPRAGWWLAFVVACGLVACAPAAPAAAPAAANPPATSAAAGAAERANWQTEWERTLASARQEGTVVVAGPPGQVYRDALMEFQKAYPGIAVEYSGLSGRDFAPKLIAEREGGQPVRDEVDPQDLGGQQRQRQTE